MHGIVFGTFPVRLSIGNTRFHCLYVLQLQYIYMARYYLFFFVFVILKSKYVLYFFFFMLKCINNNSYTTQFRFRKKSKFSTLAYCWRWRIVLYYCFTAVFCHYCLRHCITIRYNHVSRAFYTFKTNNW